MEATRPSEMSVDFCRTTQCYIPEDKYLFYVILVFNKSDHCTDLVQLTEIFH
jgi:hypothetical protein